MAHLRARLRDEVSSAHRYAPRRGRSVLPKPWRAAKQGEHLRTKYEIVYHVREWVRLPHYREAPRPVAIALSDRT